ncbi:MAG: ADP-forming succinate--CoA ligase subunit beta [Candidatus Eisenbacteria bacterium]
MNLHEYQAKELFQRAGIPIAPGIVCATPAEVRAAAAKIGGDVVVKAQVHSGGRGKAGGVKLAKTPEEAEEKAKPILALTIQGLPVRRVLVTKAVDIKSEAYAAILVDRASKRPILMYSAAGGVDIEDTAHTNPEAIRKIAIDPALGLLPYQARAAAVALGFKGKQALTASMLLVQLWDVFRDNDASLAEINPLVVTEQDEVLALDAKVSIDDNALFRHPGLETMRDSADETAGTILAREKGLSYVPLDGDIGCVVNGAGLAMTTMDLVKYYGGEPANFLDIGGSSNPEKVVAAFRIITGDSTVKAILFNIFGGITRCDDVARGILAALDQMKLDVPLVIRLTGTNEELARAILAERGLTATTSMDEGVKAVIAAAKGGAR